MKKLFILSAVAATSLFAVSMTSCKGTTPPAPETTIDAPSDLDYYGQMDRNVVLTWKHNSESTGYEIEVLGTEIKGKAVKNHYTVPTKDLEYLHNYKWRVRTLVDDRASEWSDHFFITRAESAAGDYIGTWEVERKDFEVHAKATIPIINKEIDLSELIPSGGTDKKIELVFAANPEDKHKLFLNINDLPDNFPLSKEIQGVPLKVKSNDKLQGDFPDRIKVTRPLIDKTHPNGISFSEIPGLDKLGSYDVFKSYHLTEIEITAESVSISGGFTNGQYTNIQLFLSFTAKCLLTTDAPDSVKALIGVLLGQMEVPFRGTINKATKKGAVEPAAPAAE